MYLSFFVFIYLYIFFLILHTFTTCANVVTIPNSIMLQPQQWIPYTFSAGIPGIEE